MREILIGGRDGGRYAGPPACGEVGHIGKLVSGELPLGLEKGVIMTMSRMLAA